MIITIDGPSASGKGTVARRLAIRLGLSYCDTGAMYRSLAYLSLRMSSLSLALEDFDFDERDERVFVRGEDVTEAIRTPEVTRLSSSIATQAEVRSALLQIQRKMAERGGFVFDGRDMGSVVFPLADFKFYLTATDEVRARRRFAELTAKGIQTTEEQVLFEQMQRDRNDSERSLAPLKPAQDAVIIDTSDLTIDEVVERLMHHIHSKEGR